MTERAFEKAVRFVLAEEGGATITDDPADPGGLTKYGISLRAHPGLGRAGIIGLTEERAVEIYRRDYWEKARCDALPPAVAALHFDCAVNQGVGFAAAALQESARETVDRKLAVDGAIGPKTLAAVGRADPATLTMEYAARRMNRYGRSSRFDRFGLGWSRRLMRAQALAFSVAPMMQGQTAQG